VNSAPVLAALIAPREQLQQILPQDKASWDREPVVRLAIERLRITFGNLYARPRLGVLRSDVDRAITVTNTGAKALHGLLVVHASATMCASASAP